MTPTSRSRLCMLGVGLIFCVSLRPTATAADATPGAAQQLVAPRGSSKVAAVLWTRRSDRYTLQVVFPRISGIQPVGANPSVTLWLLKADGTVISTQTEPALGLSQKVHPNEIAYSVSLAAGGLATAAALRIDEEFFIEALRPLN